jgi:hypothetical protein
MGEIETPGLNVPNIFPKDEFLLIFAQLNFKPPIKG